MFIAVRRGFHFGPGLVEKLVIFWSSFFSAGLRSAGTVWKRITCDALEHAVDEFGLFAWGFR